MPDLTARQGRGSPGFTLIEMMVTLVLLAILFTLAMPSFSAWIRNSKVRTVADSLQNGLRLAQAEATRRNRQVVFTLTNDSPTATAHTPATNGANWSLNTVAAYTNDPVAFIEAGVLTDVASGVQITGPAAICFNAMGRMVDNPAPGFGSVACSSTNQTYQVGFASSTDGVDRPLRVTVKLGGQVRMCDPAKALTEGYADGC
ncbi:GspH/FimT family pseudopilin [Variovorax sp. LARHSF232]